jgi:hypothetical protein
MARTLQEIEQSIDNELAIHTELNELQTNSSLVQFWSFLKKAVALLALNIEIMLDKHKDEVQTIISSTETGSIDWYVSICLEYQHGDSLIIDNNRPVYSVIYPSKRIVKRVAIKEHPDAHLEIKAVKELNGNYVKLDITELASFTAYIYRRKIAGTLIQVYSLDADALVIDFTSKLDSTLFDSSGKLISDSNIEPVIDAINNYTKNFDFGGVFYLSKLIDKVMSIEGVIDFYINQATLNGTIINHKVESPAGYIDLDTQNSNTNYVLS